MAVDQGFQCVVGIVILIMIAGACIVVTYKAVVAAVVWFKQKRFREKAIVSEGFVAFAIGAWVVLGVLALRWGFAHGLWWAPA